MLPFFVLALLSACIANPEISVEGAYAVKEGDVYAVFMGIINSGKGDDYLTGARVVGHEEARVEIHSATMQRLERLPIPRGEVVRLAPGEKHIMIFNLKGQVDELEIVLSFEKSGEIRTTAKVRR